MRIVLGEKYTPQLFTMWIAISPGSVTKAVFKWLSKLITWLRLLRLVIGLRDSRQFFSQWEAKPKPIAPWTRGFSRALSELLVIARNCDWFITLSAPVVIGRSNCFGFGFSKVIWKPLYPLDNSISLVGLIQWVVKSIIQPLNHWFFRGPFLESPENFSGPNSHS